MPKTIPVVAASAAPSCDDADAFALMVLGDSMVPEFVEGEIVVVEPSGEVRDGSYVLAQADGEWIFRRLRRAGEGWLLVPLNPAYPEIALGDLSAVRGVVIQKSKPGRRKAARRYVD